VRKALGGGRRTGDEVEGDGLAFEVRFPGGQNLNEQEPGQIDGQAQADGQRARLEMAGRTRAIRAKAFFGVEKMNKQSGKEEGDENAQKKEAASSSAHR
jgi:hypothetical protein